MVSTQTDLIIHVWTAKRGQETAFVSTDVRLRQLVAEEKL